MEVKNYKFHSTQQFRNVVKSIKHQAQYQGQGEDGQPIMDRTALSPILDYVGTVKLHGTNASIILHEDGVISFHSKSNMLGYISDEEFTLNSDNAEFAQSMSRRMEGVLHVIQEAKLLCVEHFGELILPLKISGEWAGQGIQKGVGISLLPKKSFFVFGLKVGESTDQENKIGWVPAHQTDCLRHNDSAIYSIAQFPMKKISINFSEPEYSQNTLVECTNNVEDSCPVSVQLGIEGNLLGEGLVWTPVDREYSYDSGNWFKTKGKKHSISKTKSVAAVCPEKLNSIKDFVEYSATTNRMEQGLSEVGLDQKLIGKFIGWVNSDINKEEGDVLESNNLSMKDVGKMLSNKTREFYLDKLNKDI